MKNIRILILASLSLCSAFAAAQGAMEINPTEGLYFEQKLGVQVPMDLPFKDENGKDVRLGDYFKERPVILVLVFYQCQSSCLLIRDGLLKTLNAQKSLKAGRDFDVVVVSINHKETPEMALTKKESYLADYQYPDSGAGWHLLTGPESSILSLTRAVGFGFKFDEVVNEETKEVTDQISHPSGLVVLTPDGMTSLYLLGAKYPQELLRRGIHDAKTEKIGPKTETILLGCFMYDPKTGKYRLVIENALKVGGLATALILFGSIFVMSMRHRRTPLSKSDSQGGAA
jgi:protein SCO1